MIKHSYCYQLIFVHSSILQMVVAKMKTDPEVCYACFQIDIYSLDSRLFGMIALWMNFWEFLGLLIEM